MARDRSPQRKSILESERSRKMVELLLDKGCKVDLSGVSLARLDLSALHMPSIVLVGSNLRFAARAWGVCCLRVPFPISRAA